ncbi:uro-adherence factor A-like [Battus philenor]|uniref:uro-adherence factor A-like n=1 Tax=Battus philenor TaxID=42288 RepID=UPI0035D0F5CA
MEVIEESPALSSSIDNVKNNVDFEENPTQCIEADVCLKSNGTIEEEGVRPADDENIITETVITEEGVEILEENSGEPDLTIEAETTLVLTEIMVPPVENVAILSESVLSECDQSNESKEPNVEIVSDSLVKTVNNQIDVKVPESVEGTKEESTVEINPKETSSLQVNNVGNTETEVLVNNSEESSDKDCVRFKTEIIVEVGDNDVKENNLNESNSDEQVAKNILSGLGQNIELSEVLRASDITDNVENNNCSTRQEVFNKEELLDILQGNDVEPSANEIVEFMEINTINNKSIEAQLAIQQLTRLKNCKKKNRSERIQKTKKVEKKEEKKTDNIINVLVKDWDDEETPETDKSVNLTNEAETLLKADDVKEVQIQVISKEELLRTSIDSSTSEDHSQKSSRSGDECQPQRRLGRIIKKKIIFDPDNPDTFTKGKTVTKNKDISVDREQTPSKKSKAELSIIRPKSKSPISKLQWKKPSPKNTKQNKRLSEVDKLLMDEGAVNMIYQLAPEAPKGKKNVKTKAEFIKKLQSSTPDSKEMKFRERKKDSSKYEDGEAKKILGGKHRVSLSSSVKSPSVCEDFETHSADDSIIYRRHSSSSYSSTCMSPRRLSDVDSGSQSTPRASQIISDKENKIAEGEVNKQESDAFMSDSTKTPNSEMINRDDCLSIKEKLNSKLSLALNKRKRESSKSDKPPKQKKVKESEMLKNINESNYKYLTISIDHRLAEITIQKGSKYSFQVIKELEQALIYVDGRKDISVTLLTSQCGTLCSSIDLRALLDEDEKKRAINAFEIAESIRSLLSTIEQHTKLLCTGVWGACWGVALALVARSDLVLGSERATFSLAASPRHVAVQPGLAAVTARCGTLPQSLINDLVVFGRRISAAEAQQGGLLSRCLWPDRFPEQLRTIARDIAAQPGPNILLKKQLLGIRKSGESLSTFLSCLETERDLLVEYWTSVEGQELLRADHQPE